MTRPGMTRHIQTRHIQLMSVGAPACCAPVATSRDRSMLWLTSGHGFSRAVPRTTNSALAPEGVFCIRRCAPRSVSGARP